ncbi:hypothetical protein AgCh_030631 [Apium graveolens]
MSESERRFPINEQDYILYVEVGDGVSATVYGALCVSFDEIVAIKVLDMEKCNNDLMMFYEFMPNGDDWAAKARAKTNATCRKAYGTPITGHNSF